MQCDICNSSGSSIIVPASQFSSAVKAGFNPFHLGCIPEYQLKKMDPGFPARWAESATRGEAAESDWNVCPSCMSALLAYLGQSASVSVQPAPAQAPPTKITPQRTISLESSTPKPPSEPDTDKQWVFDHAIVFMVADDYRRHGRVSVLIRGSLINGISTKENIRKSSAHHAATVYARHVAGTPFAANLNDDDVDDVDLISASSNAFLALTENQPTWRDETCAYYVMLREERPLNTVATPPAQRSVETPAAPVPQKKREGNEFWKETRETIVSILVITLVATLIALLIRGCRDPMENNYGPPQDVPPQAVSP